MKKYIVSMGVKVEGEVHVKENLKVVADNKKEARQLAMEHFPEYQVVEIEKVEYFPL